MFYQIFNVSLTDLVLCIPRFESRLLLNEIVKIEYLTYISVKLYMYIHRIVSKICDEKVMDL